MSLEGAAEVSAGPEAWVKIGDNVEPGRAPEPNSTPRIGL